MKRKPLVFTMQLVLPVTVFMGCGPNAQVRSSSSRDAPVLSEGGSKLLLDAQPEGAQSVIQVRENANDRDAVVVLGRIGGRKNPWIEGRAAFSIVDPTLKSCRETTGDSCPTPWDYCCETPQLRTSTALVKIVDDDGNLVRSDARQLLGLKELETVVVKGQAQLDDAGNLTVLADGVFVQDEE